MLCACAGWELFVITQCAVELLCTVLQVPGLDGNLGVIYI